MFIDAKFDSEGSKLAEKLTFVCSDFEFKKEFVDELKENNFLKFTDSDSLPDVVNCQILIYYENNSFLKIIFFDPDISFSAKIYEEPLLNKDFINWEKIHWFFWIEIEVPMDFKWIDFNLQLEI